MSTQQPAVAPGVYRTRDGREAEVFAVRDSRAYGRVRHHDGTFTGHDWSDRGHWHPSGYQDELDLLLPPAVRPWSGPGDVPMPGPVWMRQQGNTGLAMVIGVRDEGVFVGVNGNARKWAEIEKLKCEWSTDAKTWRPCTVAGE